MMEDTCKLYRHFDRDGVLLYVGISKSAVRRLCEHSSSGWGDGIASISIEVFPNRVAARVAERDAIRRERPKFNIAHSRAERFLGTNPQKEGTATMTPAERQRLKRARIAAGLTHIVVWVPEGKADATREAIAQATLDAQTPEGA